MGERPADRVKTMLGKLDTKRRGKERGYNVANDIKWTSGKFAGRVEKIFNNLPKSLEWQSFYRHDLRILMDICKEVREEAIRRGLNRSQVRALQKLKETSSKEYQRVTGNGHMASNPVREAENKDISQIDLNDLSGREINGIAEKAAKKEGLIELNRHRVSPSLKSETVIVTMNSLGIPEERIAALLKINRKTVKKQAENPRLLRSIKKYLDKGLAIHEVAKEHGCPEPLVWSIALEGKTDQERFKALNWGLRTWDHWFFNDLDQRFGDKWPGQIPAQLVGHTLYFFRQDNQDTRI